MKTRESFRTTKQPKVTPLKGPTTKTNTKGAKRKSPVIEAYVEYVITPAQKIPDEAAQEVVGQLEKLEREKGTLQTKVNINVEKTIKYGRKVV